MNVKRIIYMLYACAILLLIASIPLITLPYGFYTALRILVCLTFTIIMFREKNEDKYELRNLITIAIVILFNPVFIISMDKEIWQLIDFSSFIYSLFMIKTYHKEQKKIDTIIYAFVSSSAAADLLADRFKGITGTIEKTTEELKMWSDKFEEYWDMHEGESPKYKLAEKHSDVYICKHTFSKHSSKSHTLPGGGFIDCWEDYTEDVTLGDLYKQCDEDLYSMAGFVFDDRSSYIDMDAFNTHILPQLQRAIMSDILNKKLDVIENIYK